MDDVLFVDQVDQAAALLKPARVDLLRMMGEPTTCTELARRVEQSPQRVYYHVKALEEAGLVERVEERRVRGIVEGVYRARARSYWLSPRLVGRLGRRQAAEEISLGYLISLAEEVQEDVARLARERRDDIPSLGLSAHVELGDPGRREEFMKDVQSAFQALAEKYGARSRPEPSETYRLALACYPTPPIVKEKEENP